MDGILTRAISNKQTIEIIYVDAKQQITQRSVLPFGVIGQQLKAYCFLRKQFRLFDLENILAASPLPLHSINQPI
jgi:predicted DNA-binding transcriptional regulator YafY